MKRTIILSLRVLIGIVFILSAYTKLVTPGIVEIILVDHGITASRESAAVLVRILIGFEFALGLLFFQPFSLKKIVIPLTILFLIGFTVYLGYTGFILKDSQNCGCFGEMLKMSPVESIVKNIFMIILLAILYKMTEEKKNYFVHPIVIIISIAAVFIFSPVQSQKDFKFSKYTNFEGAGRVDLQHGRKYVFILNTDCDHCQMVIKELSKSKNQNWASDTYALLFVEGSISPDSFKTITGFKFPYHVIGTKEFFDLIGQSPPRIYLLNDGKVKEIWDKDFAEKLSRLN